MLSFDLVKLLAEKKDSLPHYRLIDVAVGIYLDDLITKPEDKIVPIHDDRIKPYRALPLFNKDAIVQHYMESLEFHNYYRQAVASLDSAVPERQYHATVNDVYSILLKAGVMKK